MHRCPSPVAIFGTRRSSTGVQSLSFGFPSRTLRIIGNMNLDVRSMDHQGTVVTEQCIYHLVRDCSKKQDFVAGKLLYVLLAYDTLDGVAKFGDNFIRLFAACNSIQDADKVFKNIIRPTVYTWNFIMSSIALTPKQESDLAEFQEISGIASTQECIMILKSHDWDLQSALHTILAANDHSSSSSSTSSSVSSSSKQKEGKELPSQAQFVSTPIQFQRSSSNNPDHFKPTFMSSRSSSSTSSSSSSSSSLSSSSSSFSSSSSSPNSISSSSSSVNGSWNFFPKIVTDAFGVATRLVTSILPAWVNPNDQKTNDCVAFIEQFEKKYENHPKIFKGMLADALRQAKRENKFVFVYLHCSSHEDTPKFCNETLCTDTISNYLNVNFITWIGNIQHSETYKLCHRLHVTTFPFVAVLSPVNDRIDIAFRYSGIVGPDALLAQLVVALDRQKQIIQKIKQRTTAQLQNRELIQQQDKEYKEALEKDKQMMLKQQQEEKRQQEEREAKRREQEEKEREQARLLLLKKKKEEERARKAASLPPEPAPAQDVVAVGIRLPSGQKITRRFTMNTALKHIFDFIESYELNVDGEEILKYQVVSHYPRRVWSDPSVELRSMGLGKQFSLFVEEIVEGKQSNPPPPPSSNHSHNNNNTSKTSP